MMRFVQIGDRLINLDNVTDISVSVDRVGIKTMAIRLRERRIVLKPEETAGFDYWLRANNLIEEIESRPVRYPTMDEIKKNIDRERAEMLR